MKSWLIRPGRLHRIGRTSSGARVAGFAEPRLEVFENANLARALERTDALEAFAWTAALGFRGIYRNESLSIGIEAAEAQLSEEELEQDARGSPHVPARAATGNSAAAVGQTRGAVKRLAEDTVSSLPHTFDEWACGPL